MFVQLKRGGRVDQWNNSSNTNEKALDLNSTDAVGQVL